MHSMRLTKVLNCNNKYTKLIHREQIMKRFKIVEIFLLKQPLLLFVDWSYLPCVLPGKYLLQIRSNPQKVLFLLNEHIQYCCAIQEECFVHLRNIQLFMKLSLYIRTV